ncbi:interleukin-6 receptor subunit beta isoform X2 [Chanos chanos]|uniref:Interleukin-6 receptor subunit beta isoform X2 n=1 Tax=Chanos chanos TaxID=29144 RepID=A0A6J2VDD6_CHACN|nr:interleukin-6 receptor subunit beta-like isoform X2 [Chanos chanos]
MDLLIRFLTWISTVHMIFGLAPSQTPVISQCELMEHANITCHWEPGNNALEIFNYTLNVNRTVDQNGAFFQAMGSCTTKATSCSVTIDTVRGFYCVDVLAHGPRGSIRSPRRCLNGILDVKLYPLEKIWAEKLPGRPRCLRVGWSKLTSSHIPSSLKEEWRHGVLQLEFSTPQQPRPHTVNIPIQEDPKELCGLWPGTTYTVRIRAQDKRADRHWSAWSPSVQSSTDEAAPAAAPEMWRHIEPVNLEGMRRITLLWKRVPWPLANAQILHYDASCSSELDKSQWDCAPLNGSSTSCVFSAPSLPCTCTLTAFNSAGTSPLAQLHIPGSLKTVPSLPFPIRVTPLGDFSLEVQWTDTIGQSMSGFVVEWFCLLDTSGVGLHWKRLDRSVRSFVITDGVQPEIPYNVSVLAVYGTVPRAKSTVTTFTRQGAPSVGPAVVVLDIGSSSVTLRWDPLPIDKQRGFIHHYSLEYNTGGRNKSLILDGSVHQFTLTGLSGQCNIRVKAYTEAGGTEGPWITVAVGRGDIPVITILWCVISTAVFVLMSLILRIGLKRYICPNVPDPSKSSLSNWYPGQLWQKGKTSPVSKSFKSPFCAVIHLGKIDGMDYSYAEVWDCDTAQTKADSEEVESSSTGYEDGYKQYWHSHQHSQFCEPEPQGLITAATTN